MQTAEDFIRKYNLQPHPEGGYFREIYRSPGEIEFESLPRSYNGKRNYLTSIYFLLKAGQVSKLHRLKSDEIWYYHAGDPLEIHVIDAGKNYHSLLLGLNSEAAEAPQAVIPGNCWFGAELKEQGCGYSFVSCAVAPGFDFADFELGRKEELLKEFLEFVDLIQRLC